MADLGGEGSMYQPFMDRHHVEGDMGPRFVRQQQQQQQQRKIPPEHSPEPPEDEVQEDDAAVDALSASGAYSSISTPTKSSTPSCSPHSTPPPPRCSPSSATQSSSHLSPNRRSTKGDGDDGNQTASGGIGMEMKQNHNKRVETSPPPSNMTSYVNRLLGSSSPFSEYRKAKNRLSKYRSLLQSEVSKSTSQMLRAKKAIKTFEEASKREEIQLIRMGYRRHTGLQNYYTSVKRTLLHLEFEMHTQAAKILETREGEINILLDNLEDVLKDDQLDDAFLRNPAELVAGDMMIVNLKKRIHWLNKACAQVKQDLKRETADVLSVDVEESFEERRRKLMHLIEECKVLYFGGGTEERWDRHDSNSPVEGEQPKRGGGGGGGGVDVVWEEGGKTRPSAAYLEKMRRPIFVRQKEVMQLRMKYEREFAHLMEDERYREGRLLRRFFELLEGGASPHDASFPSSTPASTLRLGDTTPFETPASSRPRSFTNSESQGSLSQYGTSAGGIGGSLTGGGGGGGGGGIYSSRYSVSSILPLTTPGGSTNNSQMHAPRSIVAFTNYFAIKRIKEPYQMDDSLRPALMGLTQSLIFRRARRVVFGYVNSSMKSLNHRWRQRIRRARQLSTLDLGVPEAYLPIQEEEEGKSNPTSPEKNGGGSSAEKEARRQYKQHIDDLGRSPYYETSIVLGEMAVCLTPQEMSDCLIVAMKCLHYEAMVISGNARALDADTMFPILLYALIHADLPDMYSCLYCLRHFAAGDHAGEKAYYITCLEAAVAHLDRLELPLPLPRGEGEQGGVGEYDSDDDYDLACQSHHHQHHHPGSRRGSTAERSTAANGGLVGVQVNDNNENDEEEDDDDDMYDDEIELGPSFSREDQIKAMVFLDQWLAWESAMEETIDVLEKDGWF